MNPHKRLLALLPAAPLLIGQVTAAAPDAVTVTLPSGEQLRARGSANIGDTVFVRDGAIEGPAPALEGVDIVI
jgi:hypothetical protein